MGASRYDVCKIFVFFYPLPLSAFGTDLQYKIHETPLYNVRFSVTPSPLRCGHHIWMLPNIAGLSSRSPRERTNGRTHLICHGAFWRAVQRDRVRQERRQRNGRLPRLLWNMIIRGDPC